VAECTGKFRDKDSCQQQLKAGAKKVVISAPGKEEDISIVLGVNDSDYDSKKHHVISNASCTTNCLAPVVKVLEENFGIQHAHMTTIHSVTRSQNLVDASHPKCPRRARGVLDSFIPTTTGAAKAIVLVFPKLEGRIDAACVRVPFSTVSAIDLTAELKKNTNIEEINQAFTRAAKKELQGIIGVSDKPLVSIDFKQDSRSAIVDSLLTNVIDNSLARVFAWYDNEWGYVCRLADLLRLVNQKL
jgi:glyceraldehyde 3-phosphate dehydrogenase